MNGWVAIRWHYWECPFQCIRLKKKLGKHTSQLIFKKFFSLGAFLVKYICSEVCVCVRVCVWQVCVWWMHMPIYTGRSQKRSSGAPLHILFLEAGYLTEAGGQKAPLILLLVPYSTGVRRMWPYLAFYVDPRDLSSGPTACAASSLTSWATSSARQQQCNCWIFYHDNHYSSALQFST